MFYAYYFCIVLVMTQKRRKRVTFVATKKVPKKVNVAFRTSSGKRVSFVATKKVPKKKKVTFLARKK